MSFTQSGSTCPFAMSQPAYMQSNSPPFGYSGTPHAPTPPWATEILDEIKHLRQKMKNVEVIETTVKETNSKLGKMESKFKTLELRVTETEKACAFQSSSYESAKQDLKNTNSELKKLRKKCDLLESGANKLKEDRDKLESKLDGMDARSMKVNLLYYGLKEL